MSSFAADSAVVTLLHLGPRLDPNLPVNTGGGGITVHIDDEARCSGHADLGIDLLPEPHGLARVCVR